MLSVRTPRRQWHQPTGKAEASNRLFDRRGLTVVEALVVIAIIGILGALLLPAVQAAREAARRSACKNNLHQISLGLLSHESMFRHFPSGGWGFQWYGDPDRGNGLQQPGGWPFSIVAFLEHKELAAYGAGESGPEKLESVAKMNAIPISLFYCASRRAADVYPFDMQWPPRNASSMTVAAKTDYAVNGGDYQIKAGGGPPNYANADDPNYVWPDSSKGNGVCYFRSVVSLGGIQDGAAFTYLLGEKNVATAGLDLGDDQSIFVGYDLDSTRWTSIGWPPAPDSKTAKYTQFGSSHPLVCQFAFCDGSVREISFNINEEIHRRMGNRRDGLIVSEQGLH